MADSPKYADVLSYATMDPVKVLGQKLATDTDHAIDDTDFRFVSSTRGESVQLIESDDAFWGHVGEGLGTLNAIPEQVMRYIAGLTPEEEARMWYAMGQSNAAMIFNDLSTLGVRLLMGHLHIAAGHKSWFERPARIDGLFSGWRDACLQAGGVWVGGETSTLRDVVEPSSAVLGGSASGIIKPKKLVITGNIRPGMRIIIANSTGVHANGITLLRDLLPAVGYRAVMANGEKFVTALTQPTPIYAAAVHALQQAGIEIYYCVNVTGHGWRKFVRATTEQSLEYLITKLPPELEIFRYILSETGMSLYDLLNDYNCGAGYAFMVAPEDVERAVAVLLAAGFPSFDAGEVREADSTVVNIEPLGIVFEADTLQVR